MDKDSVMYLLMDMRVNGILDRILEKDEEYQEIARKSVEYLDRLEVMNLPQEARSLIDKHSCEQNALGGTFAVRFLYNREGADSRINDRRALPGHLPACTGQYLSEV